MKTNDENQLTKKENIVPSVPDGDETTERFYKGEESLSRNDFRHYDSKQIKVEKVIFSFK